ncbi:hypothetical protein [Petrocella sp. FN5]|uniref:hypothetical protein n=1 Tax=Petrocella sp. FN5 TaxID=3032002 RepID=UPI0023DC4FB4|nr:hypothetical protein [Petrocella sp. FN5]MDF1618648.1 hypothetical protein [Petrocella sp. FN5]
MNTKYVLGFVTVIMLTSCQPHSNDDLDYEVLYNEQLDIVDEITQENEQLESEYTNLEAKLKEQNTANNSTDSEPAEFLDALDEVNDSIEELIDFYNSEMNDVGIGSGYGEAFGDEIIYYYFNLDFDEFMTAILKVPFGRIDNLAANMVTSLNMKYQYEEISENEYKYFIKEFEDLSRETEINEEYRQFVYEILAHVYSN